MARPDEASDTHTARAGAHTIAIPQAVAFSFALADTSWAQATISFERQGFHSIDDQTHDKSGTQGGPVVPSLE